MSEHARSTDYSGNVYQWVDSELCMVLNRWTGEPLRLPRSGVIITFEEALGWAKESPASSMGHYIIVRMPCVESFRI